MVRRVDVSGHPIGYSALPQFNGFVFGDFLPELQGARGRKTIREMLDNDPTIGAVMFGIEMAIRGVEYRIQVDENAPDDERGQLIEESLHDMSSPWPDKVSEIVGFCGFGWGLHEQIYKIRDGINSKFSDGKIGWADWSLRGQESLLRWEFDDVGNVLGMWQLGPPSYKEVFIPLEKALLFRTSIRMGNPEGRPLLRNAYTSWFFLKHIRIFEGIGIERDLAGFPLLRIPGRILAAGSDKNANPQDVVALTGYQNFIEGVKIDEEHGAIIPSDLYTGTNVPQYNFELLRSAGNKQFDTSQIIDRYKLEIAQTVLADFIQLGHSAVGSRALAESKTEMFNQSLRALLQVICSVVSDIAIPRLLRLNGMSTDMAPRLVHGDIERPDLQALAQYLTALGDIGVQMDTSFNSELTKDLMQKGTLPDPPDDPPDNLNLDKNTAPQPTQIEPPSDELVGDDSPVDEAA